MNGMWSKNELSFVVGFFDNRLLFGPDIQPTPAETMTEAVTAVKKRRLTRIS